jgi:glycosyltransferase involved in cell wall biosynthesis
LGEYFFIIFFKNAINKSTKILVPSNFVKKQLIDDWKINSQKIIVIPEAVDDSLLAKEGKPPSGIKKPYIFYVGNAHPHKNVEGLIKAFLLLKKKYGDLKLVLSGYDHYFWQRIKKEYQHQDIIYTGYVSEEKLVTLYKNALLFVMPSFEEGFGIPLLEAMACECPVVSSNAGSLPEVGGDGAIYFDPKNIDDMVLKISQVLNSDKLRKELVEKGFRRYKDFSWERLAKLTLEAYTKCV